MPTRIHQNGQVTGNKRLAFRLGFPTHLLSGGFGPDGLGASGYCDCRWCSDGDGGNGVGRGGGCALCVSPDACHLPQIAQ